VGAASTIWTLRLRATADQASALNFEACIVGYPDIDLVRRAWGRANKARNRVTGYAVLHGCFRTDVTARPQSHCPRAVTALGGNAS